ncbi:PREDICTED: uncharacterized protein LOC108361178 [Rhagoletis zephyria]|uniref:uncharacterized protein LOC108361178 n=1 Tax=Rhagoletis zephyria TaxID=28612 RepID=UPI000811557E|nr:PREDICTED: uncharacterized protein LOC108361178 [Rhagoletis zephyria]
MPCFCGHRVERAQTSVQCENCREIYHLDCVVGNLPADPNYLNNAENIYICGLCAPAQLDESLTSHNSSLQQQQAIQVQVPMPPTGDDNFNELKRVNSQLLAAVTALHNDNECLRQKTDCLQAEVRDLHCKLNENNTTLSHLLTRFENFFDVYNNNTAKSMQPASTCAPTGAMGSVDVVSNAAETTADTAANPPQPNEAAAAASISTATQIPIAATSQSSSPTSGIVVKPPAVVGNENEWRTVQNKKKYKRSNKNKIVNNKDCAPNNANVEAGTSSMPDSAESNNNAPITNDNISSADNLSVLGTGNAVLAQQQINDEREFEDNAAWAKVNNIRRNNNVIVVGSNASTELCIADRMMWAHLSSFDPKVTADDIKNYVCKHVNIDKKALSCYALVKKDDPAENRTHVNFRLGVLKIWPINVRVKPFNFFRKRGGRKRRGRTQQQNV